MHKYLTGHIQFCEWNDIIVCEINIYDLRTPFVQYLEATNPNWNNKTESLIRKYIFKNGNYWGDILVYLQRRESPRTVLGPICTLTNYIKQNRFVYKLQ